MTDFQCWSSYNAGLGVANVAGAAFAGYPATGSFARSAVAQYAGARTSEWHSWLAQLIMSQAGCLAIDQEPLLFSTFRAVQPSFSFRQHPEHLWSGSIAKPAFCSNLCPVPSSHHCTVNLADLAAGYSFISMYIISLKQP